MNKALVTAAIVGTAILSPVVGMGIGETRSLLLGLAPEEQILTLADQLDTNRVANDQKFADLQALVSTQQTTIAEQKEVLEAQAASSEQTKADVLATNATITKQKDCSKDVTNYCSSDSFTDPAKFSDFLDVYKKSYKDDPDKYEQYKDQFTTQFNKCQSALNCN